MRFLFASLLVAALLAVTLMLPATPPALLPAAFMFVLGAIALFALIVTTPRAVRYVGRVSGSLAVLAVFCAAGSLVACAPTSSSSSTPGSPAASSTVTAAAAGDSVPLLIAKTEYGFEALYNVAGNAYLSAVNAGLPAATKAKVKPLLIQAYGYVQAARKAAAAADQATVDAQSGNLTGVVQDILSLLPAPAPTAGASTFPATSSQPVAIWSPATHSYVQAPAA